MQYNNPIISGFHPDPSICRVDEDYYLVTSTFEYFPGVPIFHSKDLVNWRQIGHCLTTEEQLPLANAGSSGGIYAPTLRYHDGWFYMTTTNVSGGGNFLVRSKKPEGPWSNPIFVAQGGIDPSLLFDEGRVYFQSATVGDQGEGIYQCEIDPETGEMFTESRLLWKGTGGAHPEAPHLYKIGSYYYLMIAEGGTEYGHMETVARSADPYGPFESCPNNPILTNRSLNKGIHAAGHADLVQAHDGSWWAVSLGIRPSGYPMRHHLGREVFLAPVTWTADGWPIIGNGGCLELLMDGPEFKEVSWPKKPVRDDFDDQELALNWTFLRNPQQGSWSLSEHPGYLTLRGNIHTLNESASPAFVGIRLAHFTCQIGALLTYEPVHNGEEAGLTVFMNERYHYELAVTRIAGEKKMIFRRTVGSLKMEKIVDCPQGAVHLQVHTRPERFTFLVGHDGEQAREIGSGEAHFLSTEMAGGFTGVMVAMYAACPVLESSPALFDWFDYKLV